MADEYGQQIWREDEAAATAEAKRRIAAAAETGATTLNFEDLGALQAIPAEITDLPGLESLWCGESDDPNQPGHLGFFTRSLRDISALASLTRLQQVGFSRTPITDFSPLRAARALQQFHANGIGFADAELLSSFPSLTVLQVNHHGLSNFDVLEHLPHLQFLNLSFAQGDLVKANIEKLHHCRALERIDLDHTNITTIDFLHGLTQLRVVDLDRTKISSLAPLSTAQGLETLYVAGPQVTDLTPLGQKPRLRGLSLRGSQVKDLSYLLDLPAFAAEKSNFLNFADTPAADPENDRRLHMLSLLSEKDCAVQTVQYLKGTHPDFRDPPKSARGTPSLATRLAQAGDVALTVNDGVLQAQNAEPPARLAPIELGQRLDALRSHLNMLLTQADRCQVPQATIDMLNAYAKALNDEVPTYIMLDGPMSFLRGGVNDSYVTEALDGGFVEGWKHLVKSHDELRVFLVPEEDDQLPPLSDDATPEAVEELRKDVQDAFEEAGADESVTETIGAIKDYTDAAKADQKAKPGLLRKAVKTLGGMIGTVVLQTVTKAVKEWLMSKGDLLLEALKPIWEALLRLFPGG